MKKYFRIKISKDQLQAELSSKDNFEEDFKVTKADLMQFLTEEKITFGIIDEALEKIISNVHAPIYPIVIAEGVPPKNGHDAYLVNETKKKEDTGKEKKRERFHFRNIIDIPNVTSGQLLATTIPPTPGTDGTSVRGTPIRAKDGKPLRIRSGKNVLHHEEQYFSTLDGQVSITEREISVNPVFEVREDLDMKVGNIDFAGNVVIRGNVATGYTVKAGGDIKIHGLVEGAHLQAGGNIVITGGITGGNRGTVVADGCVYASYINQATVEAGTDVFATVSVMHSNITAGGAINFENALVIGGKLSARTHMYIKEVGNHLFTKTILHLGADPALEERERTLEKEIKELTENIKKLTEIEEKLAPLVALGKLPEQQLQLLSRQKATMDQMTEELFDKDEELQIIQEEKAELGDLSVSVSGIIYPNTQIQFGKYAKLIQKEHQNAKFTFEDKEIIFKIFK